MSTQPSERGWFVLGPEVESFEAEFATATGSKHTTAVASGTDALTLTLRGLGIGAGDDVITTALSAVFTAQAIMMAGARPVFADIDPDRLTVDPAAVEALVGPRTAAVIPVHLYGQPADLPALAAVADRHGLALVADCRRVQFLSDQEPGGVGGRRSRLHARRLTGHPATPAAQRRPDEPGPPHGTGGAFAAR